MEDETPTSWLLHFGHEPFSSADRRVKLIERLCLFFLNEQQGWPFLALATLSIKRAIILPIDFDQLCSESRIDDLRPAIELQPQEALGCLAAAAFEVCMQLIFMLSQQASSAKHRWYWLSGCLMEGHDTP